MPFTFFWWTATSKRTASTRLNKTFLGHSDENAIPRCYHARATASLLQPPLKRKDKKLRTIWVLWMSEPVKQHLSRIRKHRGSPSPLDMWEHCKRFYVLRMRVRKHRGFGLVTVGWSYPKLSPIFTLLQAISYFLPQIPGEDLKDH